MRAPAILVILGLTASTLAQDDIETPAADEFFKVQYASLYNDRPWDKIEEILPFYAETIHHHDDSVIHNSREWISNSLQEWKIEGWIRSEIADLDYDLLNPTTASFKAKWRDYYTGGNIDYECSWYLADFIEGKWLITEFATISCADHGL